MWHSFLNGDRNIDHDVILICSVFIGIRHFHHLQQNLLELRSLTDTLIISQICVSWLALDPLSNTNGLFTICALLLCERAILQLKVTIDSNVPCNLPARNWIKSINVFIIIIPIKVGKRQINWPNKSITKRIMINLCQTSVIVWCLRHTTSVIFHIQRKRCAKNVCVRLPKMDNYCMNPHFSSWFLQHTHTRHMKNPNNREHVKRGEKKNM